MANGMLFFFPFIHSIKFHSMVVILGGVVVSLLAPGPKVHRFKPSLGHWIFKGDKSLQHAFLF
jgi:hypothetical protein